GLDWAMMDLLQRFFDTNGHVPYRFDEWTRCRGSHDRMMENRIINTNYYVLDYSVIVLIQCIVVRNSTPWPAAQARVAPRNRHGNCTFSSANKSRPIRGSSLRKGSAPC